MFPRPYWMDRIERAWRGRSVIWLKGVRRVGKTVLARSVAGGEYLDCELPRVRRDLEDPEAFLRSVDGRILILDEVHRLDRPSELLKIAADHFPDIRVLATGSSSLTATAKFADALAGRKTEIWLTPMILDDLSTSGIPDLDRRLLRGGLPPLFLADEIPELEFQEWLDAFWAKDILELFRLRQRAPFMRFLELLMIGSGGMFEATRFARPCEVSRTTITNYLHVLETTLVAYVVRPFASNPRAEIVSAPKVYGFDTGFVAYFRGWNQLRSSDRGALWEHVVLNELLARRPAGARVQYWRSKHGNEIDFVLQRRGGDPIALECKWSVSRLEARNFRAFRGHYPRGQNFLVASDVDRPMKQTVAGIEVDVVGLPHLLQQLQWT